MNIYSDFRNRESANNILRAISKVSNDKKIGLMEVCGGHTNVILKYGIDKILGEYVNFIHGPGCPVCIIPKSNIDSAISLARMPETIFLTLGDVLKVPGSKTSLLKTRAQGFDIRALYSPGDAIEIAKKNQNKKIIFFSIGFETTTPMSASLVDRVVQANLKNVFFYINNVIVIPPMESVVADESTHIQALIAPGHVSVISGAKIYENLVKDYSVPIVVSGFEPVDILESVYMIVKQIHNKQAKLEIQYSRCVNLDGNLKAKKLVDKYFELRDSYRWRGVGEIPKSSLKLRDEYSYLDVEKVFSNKLVSEDKDDHPLCICSDILKGLAKPTDCKIFAKACSPKTPYGACMVSQEGACSIYYKYRDSVCYV